MQPNLKRLLEHVDHVFATRNDPSQIAFTEADMEKMESLHYGCLQEAANEDGPISWVAVIPTSLELMHQFIRGELSERQLFNATEESTPQQAVYLCSAIVLPEYRRSGIAFDLSVRSIRTIQEDRPIEAAFVWPFTEEGESLARKVASTCSLPLFVRPR
jgi:hypothetical protein